MMKKSLKILILFNDYANNIDWKDKQTELDIEEGEGLFQADDIGAMKHGYGALRFAERMYFNIDGHYNSTRL